jgi:hypothetical protein
MMTSHRDPVLAGAIGEARLLLAYAAENGIALDPALVATIVGAQLSVDPASADDVDAQARFWLAFAAIARAVHPVSADSIAATMTRHERRGFAAGLLDRLLGNKPTSHAERSIYRFSLLSFVVLVCLLVTQMYWVIGARLEAQSGQLIGQAEALSGQMLNLRKARLADDAPEALQLEAAGEQLDLELAIRVDALDRWNDVWQALLPGIRRDHDDAAAASPFTTLRKARLEAGLAKECIELYLLPLLYGLLGSCLHVLRSLSAGIERRTHVPSRLYQVRIYTGGLAGLVVGWFGLGGEAAGSLASLTPFALAFLAGYSVEVLFAFMDRLVAVFAGRRDAAGSEAGPRR